MNHAVWIGRRQVRGLIILLALLPLIPTSLLVHTLWQQESQDQSLALDELNLSMVEQLSMVSEKFSEKQGNREKPETLANFLLHILGKDIPIRITNHDQDIVHQSTLPISDRGISYQLENGQLKDWLIEVDTVSMITYNVAEESRGTLIYTVGALLATLIIAGGVWFAVNRNLKIDGLRKDLVTTISHEIKTPVSAIKILTESLEQGEMDLETQAEYVSLIGKENQRIENLANRFLTYSRLDSGQLPLDTNSITQLDDVYTEVITSMAPGFNSANGSIEQSGYPVVNVKADPTGLTILLTNLLENALKYGGSPPIVSMHTQIEADDSLARITIADNGSGISTEERKAVFRQFYRSGGRLDDGQTGTGLGLSICRRIAKELNLSFKLIEASKGEFSGATFQLEIPLANKTS